MQNNSQNAGRLLSFCLLECLADSFADVAVAEALGNRDAFGDWEGACDELAKWVWGGGRKLPGLVARRAAEASLLK